MKLSKVIYNYGSKYSVQNTNKERLGSKLIGAMTDTKGKTPNNRNANNRYRLGALARCQAWGCFPCIITFYIVTATLEML